MYPNITIEIKDGELALFLYSNENDSRKLSLKIEDFRTLVINLARKLNLVHENTPNSEVELSDLFNLAREADELFITSYPEMNLDDTEFNLNSLVDALLKDTDLTLPYKVDDISRELIEELQLNQNKDLFASALDYIYVIIASKAVLAASELGLGNIRLSDENKNSRMQEKIALEFENLGVELIIE